MDGNAPKSQGKIAAGDGEDGEGRGCDGGGASARPASLAANGANRAAGQTVRGTQAECVVCELAGEEYGAIREPYTIKMALNRQTGLPTYLMNLEQKG